MLPSANLAREMLKAVMESCPISSQPEAIGNEKRESPHKRPNSVTTLRRKRAAAAAEEAALNPAPAGRLERTRRLILAALRVWELKRKIRD